MDGPPSLRIDFLSIGRDRSSIGMLKDAQGLDLSTSSEAARAAWDHAMNGYLTYRADMPARLARLLEQDADFALAHTLKGLMMMLGFKEALVPVAREAHGVAVRLARTATERERMHVAALGHWIEGDLDRTLAVWEEIVDRHPRDVLAFRLHHFNAFWLGRPEDMQRRVELVLPHWSHADKAYGSVLACRAFAHEECGNYTVAESAGRQAIEIDRGDVWAAHAIAHVLEMQGRRGEGIHWLETLEPNWQGANNLTHHLWWHRGLYHLERGEHDAVLELYDTRFRNLASPLTQAQPDLYIDIQNAASMLFRLERQGADVGARWEELADKAEARIGDCLNPFTLPHWMMALAATRRTAAAERMLAALRQVASRNTGTVPGLVRDYALPVCEAVLARAKGDPAGGVAKMRAAVGGMFRLGGSHAQQDVLEQVFLDCAVKAGLANDARLMLERVAGRHPVPPERRAGYREAARQYAH
jgi:tetratricopeptide (TPR) repeat protein